MVDYKIEEAQLTDFDGIDEVEQDVFDHPFPKAIYIHDFNNNRFSRYFKMTAEGQIIGYAAIWVIYNECQIVSIGIKKNFQRQGLGKKFMDFIIDYVKSHACVNITLEVRISNEPAMNLYYEYGFYKVALRKHYYENGEDAFLMKCDL